QTTPPDENSWIDELHGQKYRHDSHNTSLWELTPVCINQEHEEGFFEHDPYLKKVSSVSPKIDGKFRTHLKPDDLYPEFWVGDKSSRSDSFSTNNGKRTWCKLGVLSNYLKVNDLAVIVRVQLEKSESSEKRERSNKSYDEDRYNSETYYVLKADLTLRTINKIQTLKTTDMTTISPSCAGFGI
ncbi:MAG: hypothetical protein ACI9SQ_002120, partial [Rubritalea sp.]